VNAKGPLQALANAKTQFCNRKLTQLLKKVSLDYTSVIAILLFPLLYRLYFICFPNVLVLETV